MRILLIPIIRLIDAWKYAHWILGLTKNEQDLGRRRYFMGWFDPRMEEHWDRLFNPKHPDYGSFMHSASNVSAELARLDPQRSAKAAGIWFSATLLFAALFALAVVL